MTTMTPNFECTIRTAAKIIAKASGRDEQAVYQQLRGWREREALKPMPSAIPSDTAAYVFDEIEIARAYILLKLHNSLQLHFDGVKSLSGWLRIETHRSPYASGGHDSRTFERCYNEIRDGKGVEWDLVVSLPNNAIGNAKHTADYEIAGKWRYERGGIYLVVALNDELSPLVDAIKPYRKGAAT